MCTPNSEPSPKYVRIVLARNATVTTISSMPWRFNRSMTCSIIGRLTSGSIGLGTLRRERTQPGAFAARHDHGLHALAPIAVVIWSNLPNCRSKSASCRGCRVPRGATLAQRPHAHRHVERGGVERQHESGDAGHAAEHRKPVLNPLLPEPQRNSGKANMSPNVPALPNQVTSIRFAPNMASTNRRARRRAPRGRAR